MTKYKFYIDAPGGCKHSKIVEYEEEPTKKELRDEMDAWMAMWIGWGFTKIKEEQ